MVLPRGVRNVGLKYYIYLNISNLVSRSLLVRLLRLAVLPRNTDVIKEVAGSNPEEDFVFEHEQQEN